MFGAKKHYFIRIKNNVFYPFLIIGITGLLFHSCKASKDVIFTVEHKLDSILTKKGKSFIIKIESSYGNGYQWLLDKSFDSNFVRLDSTSVFRSSNALNDESSMVWINFHFYAKEQGTILLKFNQARVWEKENPIDSAYLHVAIEP